MREHYDVLGVSKTASGAQIRKAFREKSLIWHPDKSQGCSAKSSTDIEKIEFMAIQTAYELLIDPEKRAQYDRYDIPPYEPALNEIERLEAVRQHELSYYEGRLSELNKLITDESEIADETKNKKAYYEKKIAVLKSKKRTENDNPLNADEGPSGHSPQPASYGASHTTPGTAFFALQSFDESFVLDGDNIVYIDSMRDDLGLNVGFKDRAAFDQFNQYFTQCNIHTLFDIEKPRDYKGKKIVTVNFYHSLDNVGLPISIDIYKRQDLNRQLEQWIQKHYPGAPSVDKINSKSIFKR